MPSSGQYTAKQVADWMFEQFQQRGELYQVDVISAIEARFGNEFMYDNASGNLAIAPSVLKEFRKLTPDAVWERGDKYWRRRQEWDEPGRQQD
jgi:hypothetical protein